MFFFNQNKLFILQGNRERFFLKGERVNFFLFFLLYVCLILLIFYIFYSNSIILCDGETLYQLKKNLSNEISCYKEAYHWYEFWRDKHSSALKEPGSTNYKLWEFLSDNSIDSLRYSHKVLKNIRLIERSIKNIDPNFNKCLEEQPCEKIVFTYTDYQN
jgi:hypothetical protein